MSTYQNYKQKTMYSKSKVIVSKNNSGKKILLNITLQKDINFKVTQVASNSSTWLRKQKKFIYSQTNIFKNKNHHTGSSWSGGKTKLKTSIQLTWAGEKDTVYKNSLY